MYNGYESLRCAKHVACIHKIFTTVRQVLICFTDLFQSLRSSNFHKSIDLVRGRAETWNPAF